MSGNSQEDILVAEVQGIQKIIASIKLIAFKILFVLLKDNEEEEVLGLFFETGADYMQMLNFPFNQKIQVLWKASDFLQIVFQIVNIFSISRYMPTINYDYFVLGIYMLNLVILLIIFDILYVSWSFSKKKFGMTWPLTILRSVASLVVTVFFLPITEILLGIVQCETQDGVLVHSNFLNIECYQGWHLVHTIVTCFFIFAFLVIASIVALTYFEPKMKTKDRTARQDSRSEVSFITNKVINQTIFSFMPEGSIWILVIICFGLSIDLHWVYNVGDPYYDQEVGLFYQVISTYYLWTNFMMFMSQLLYYTSFNGGLIAWFIGLPFIYMIMSTTKKSNIQTLTKSQVKFHSGEEVQQHLRYVLQLIDQHKTNQNSYILLVGYIEKHKEICNEEDCALKARKRKKLNMGETEMDEVCRLLLKELDRMYQTGLKKFNMSTKLRLSYVFFLIERFGKVEKAREELRRCENTKPSFAENFIIFRTVEKLKESHNEDEDSDVVKAITFDSYLTQWEEYMTKSGEFHKEFWTELREENPDLTKLNLIGSRISKTGYEVKELYTKMNKINSKVPAIHQVYGEYLLNVLNDQESSDREVQIAQDLKAEMINNQQNSNLALLTQPFPHAIVSNRKGQVGQIKQVNILFTILFGYQRNEILGKKVNYIMPDVYAKRHDELMKKFQENLVMNQNNFESDYFNPLGKSKFGKSKNGYIFPLRYFVTFLNDDCTDFIATFRAETNLKEPMKTYIITDEQGFISDTSSSVIQNFGILKNSVKKSRKMKLQQICKEAWTEQNQLLLKHKEMLITNPYDNDALYKFKVRAYEIQLMIQTRDALEDEEESSEEILGIRFEFERGDRVDQEIPNALKVGSSSPTTIPVPQRDTLSSAPSYHGSSPAHQQSSYQGSFDESSTLFSTNNLNVLHHNKLHNNHNNHNSHNNNNNHNNLNSSHRYNSNMMHQRDTLLHFHDNLDVVRKSSSGNKVEKKKKKLDETMWGKFVLNLYNSGETDSYNGDSEDENDMQLNELAKIDFGQNIVTRRLVNNHIESVWEDSKNDIDSEDPETSVFREQYGDKFDNEEDRVLFNQKGSTLMIRNALSRNHTHKSITYFQITSYVWISFLMILSITQFLLCNDQLDQFKLDVEVVQLFNMRVFEFNQMVSRVIDIVAFQETKSPYDQVLIQSYKQEIKDTVSSFIENSEQIFQPIYDRYTSGFNQNYVISIKDDGENFTYKTINQFDAMFFV